MINQNVKLNFMNEYYIFYDWLSTDNIKDFLINKIYKVSCINIRDLITKKILLLNKDIKQNEALLFTDTFTYIAVIFSDNTIKYYSSLSLQDEEKLNHYVDYFTNIELSYKIIGQIEKNEELRISFVIKNTILKEIELLKNEKKLDKLNYLYYKWFDKVNNNTDIIYDNMYKKLNEVISSKEIYIYNIIKNSYKLV